MSIFFGIVTDTKDADGLGRVQVKLPDYATEIKLPWVRVAQPLANAKSGALILPEIDDHVVIAQGPGGVYGMVVIGSLYTGANKSVLAEGDGKNNIKQVLTRGGHQITLDDTDGAEKITIQTTDAEVSFVMDKAQTTLTLTGKTLINLVSDTKITLDVKGVLVTCEEKKVTISGGDVVVTGDSIKLG